MTKDEKEALLKVVGPHEFMRIVLRRKHGQLKNAAKAIGISQAMLSAVLTGKRRATDRIMAECGLVVVTRYEVVE